MIKCGGCGRNLQLHTSRKQRKDARDESSPSQDVDEDHWRFEPLGTTFAERWQGMGVTEIGEDLIHAGITVRCHPRDRGSHVLDIPDDFRERLAKFLR